MCGENRILTRRRTLKVTETNRGTIFCIGVGPGDPELLTLKAVRLIRGCDVIAAAGRSMEESTAYQIALQAVPEIGKKSALPIEMPMKRDPAQLAQAHRRGADRIEKVLESGRSVGYLILGDPSIYGSFTYLHKILQEDGFTVQFCSGVTSFCAAAARLGISLAEGDEQLRIVPGLNRESDTGQYSAGNTVIMKAGSGIGEIREELKKTAGRVYFVEKCGRDGERVAIGAEKIPADAGYMSLIMIHNGFTKY